MVNIKRIGESCRMSNEENEDGSDQSALQLRS